MTTAAKIEFARALELVCRRLNPPHRPLPVALSLKDLGLAGLGLRHDDPLLSYRYVRGLELTGPAPGTTPGSVLWAAEPGLVHAATAAVEVAPGLLAVGDTRGFVRVFSRRGRGRWESAAALHSHAGPVVALLPLPPDGVASAGADGRIALWQADGRGRWRRNEPARWQTPGGPIQAMARLKDGSLLVGVQRSLWQLQRLPSGEWSAEPLDVGMVDLVSLAAWHDGFAVVDSFRRLHLWLPAAGGFQMLPAGPHASDVSDAIAWHDGGVLFGTQRGQVVHLGTDVGESGSLVLGTQTLSPAPISRLQPLGTGGLITWSDGQLRLWQQGEDGFRRLADFHNAEPCFAALCDGRVVFAERRGMTIAAPDASGTWRSDELVSAYEPGITAVAALAPDRVAIVERGNRLRMIRLKADDIEVEHSSTRYTVQALAAVDAETLACVLGDGQVATLSRSAAPGTRWGPALEPVPWPTSVTPTGMPMIAGGRGYLLAVLPALPPIMWRREGAQMMLVPAWPGAPEFAQASALAVAGSGRCAVTSGRDLFVCEDEEWRHWTRSDLQAPIIGLHWENDDGDLLLLDADGRVSRVNTRPWQEAPVADLSARLGDNWRTASPAWAVATTLGPCVAARDGIAGERGPIGGTRAGLAVLAASGDIVFGGGDALYVFDVRPQSPPAGADASRAGPRVRRIVVSEDAALVADLVDAPYPGRIARLWLRRRNDASWNVLSSAGGTWPDDALLQSWVGLVAGDGTVADIGDGDHATFNADRTILRADDPG